MIFACGKDVEQPDREGPTPYNLEIPSSLPNFPIPPDNPLTVEGVALGKRLFYDPLLSGNNTQSCGSCHNQMDGFTDHRLQFSTGIDGITGNRNSMPLFNLGYADGFFWDGGASTLESQVLGPIINPIEMHEDISNCVAELQNDSVYPGLFKGAFGTDSITISLVMKAIAQFERTILSGNSRYDRYKSGQGSLTAQEIRGMTLFEDFQKGDCIHCHTLGRNFSDFSYRNNGLDSIPVDSGRAIITQNPADAGKFKVPTLRNIEVTGPYMHDGRFSDLQQVMDHYNTGFHYPPNLDVNIRLAVKGRMSQQEMDDIIAFLKTLTDQSFLTSPAFSRN
ncbi:MAG: cytochrome-c peroxidase [Bacteroidota bacterium]